MSGEKTGLPAALDGLEPGEPPGTDGGEQQDLFGTLPLAPALDVPSARRGPGRPKGSQNRSSKAWAAYLLSRYPSPLEGLANVAFRPLPELQAQLGCDAREALQLQVKAMEALAPYVHSKQPIAIDAGENGLVRLVINLGDQPETLEAVPITAEGESEENQ